MLDLIGMTEKTSCREGKCVSTGRQVGNPPTHNLTTCQPVPLPPTTRFGSAQRLSHVNIKMYGCTKSC